jgi:uncharacterized protein YwgA
MFNQYESVLYRGCYDNCCTHTLEYLCDVQCNQRLVFGYKDRPPAKRAAFHSLSHTNRDTERLLTF